MNYNYSIRYPETLFELFGPLRYSDPNIKVQHEKYTAVDPGALMIRTGLLQGSLNCFF